MIEKVLIGAGHSRGYIKGYTTIDIDAKAKPDILGDAVVELSKLDDDSLKKIVSHHFIEHISLTDARRFLHVCYKKLKKDGVLITEFPDMKARCRRVADGEDDALWGIFGDSSRPHYGHKYGYTETSFKRMLIDSGFNLINAQESVSGHGLSICITAIK